MLAAIGDTFRRYLSLPAGAPDVLALWCAHSHAFDLFHCTPRLNLYSPEKGCGKSTTLDMVKLFVPIPVTTESLTTAVLFRLVQKITPTLLIDEVDSFLEGNEELRGLLNGGHKRGGQTYRCVGDDHSVRSFSVHCPVVLAGIGRLPATLHDRSIVIPLVRAKPGEIPERFDFRRTHRESELCRKLARWVADVRTELEQLDPRLPDGCYNRPADNWRPIFAVAEAVGGDWPERARRAYASLAASGDVSPHGRGAELLADIRDVFIKTGLDRMPSARICEDLKGREDRPWPEFRNGQPITPVQMAKLLKPFEIIPRDIRVNLECLKGYHVADFADAWERYLPPVG